MLKLHDFIPIYRQIHSDEFDRDVNSLTEFSNFRLDKEEELPENPGDLMRHQKLISNFISPNTPYDGLLVVHAMGTGKTCTSVAVAEKFITVQEKIPEFPETIFEKKHIFVLTRGRGLQNNFIGEIANVCTSKKYLSEKDGTQTEKMRRIRKNVSVNYVFDTFEVFSKKLKVMSVSDKKMRYENSLFIVDEAHNLRMSSNEEERNIYREFLNLFDLLKKRKILLLTGTPMKDQPDEIVDILNLILREKLTLDDLENRDVFMKKTKGYVSYLRPMMSDVDRTEEGRLLGSLSHFKVYPVFMQEFQSKFYAEAMRKDEDEKSIFNNSRQASLMVFPDGTYGKDGFENNVLKTSTGFIFNPKIVEKLKNNLSMYSVKYFDLIEKLKKDAENGRLSFVFSEYVKGSGLIILGLLLEMNGFTKATHLTNFSVPKKRFVIFTNETSSDTQTRRLISVFNDPKNFDGKFISVIIGSRVIMEGFSFKNIQAEYILTPHWNFSETSQIIARGFRLGSHSELIKNGISPNVKIFLIVALPDSSDSIDLHMYQISEQKDFQMQKVIRMLKESAFDCVLNKERNTVLNKNLDFTRDCEYSTCEYKCENSEPIRKDDRNYRLLFFKSSNEFQKVKRALIDEIRKTPITVTKFCEKRNFLKDHVLIVLDDLITNNEIIFKRPEGVFYVSISQRNLIFPSTSTMSLDPLNGYTLSEIFIGKTIDELIIENEEKFMVNLIRKIFQSENIQQLQSHLISLPVVLQEKLICGAISSPKNIEKSFVRDMILNNFKLYFRIVNTDAFVWFNNAKPLINTNISNVNLWRPCTFLEKQKIEQIKKEVNTLKIENNKYGFVGLLNRNTNDFCLRKIDEGEESDKRKKNVGKRCQNWKKSELVDLISNRMKVVPDDDFHFDEKDVIEMKTDPKFKNLLNVDNPTLRDFKRTAFWNAQDMSHICRTILNNLSDQKLVIEDPNCGTSKKIR